MRTFSATVGRLPPWDISDMRSRPDRQGQERHVGPIRHCPGWEGEEEDQDDASGAQPCVE